MEETYVKSSQVFFYALLGLCIKWRKFDKWMSEIFSSKEENDSSRLSMYKCADFNLDENEEWTAAVHSLAVDKWHLALGDLFLLLSLLMTNFEWKVTMRISIFFDILLPSTPASQALGGPWSFPELSSW